MAEYEKVHFLTEAIFKNVLDNFNPGLKQLISTGRALQKALHNASTQTKAYVECIYSLAQSAQVCKGATSDIGGALLQIAEVHKEINTQVIDNIKSFHSDLLIPLETKQENEFKHLQLIHKKYSAGHKFHQAAYDKAQNALKKHRKKTKAKYGFDQKELQYAREVKETYQKLEEYQMQNLRLALLEERKRYCYLLDRICAMVRNYASHHSKAHELFTHRLSEWTELCKSPHILPQSSEGVINAFKNQDDLYTTADDVTDIERRALGDYDRQPSNCEDSNSYTYGTTQRSMEVDENCHNMPNGMLPTQPDYSGSLNQELMVPVHDTQRHVRALYTHSGVGDTQLSFVSGDIIMLIGEARGGWQYGENTRTHRMGWFPVSFTEPLQMEENRQSQDFRLTTQRVKSLGNLSDLQDLNQDFRLSGLHVSGHSDSESVNVRLRDHRNSSHGERPVSFHIGAMAPSVQLPTKHRLGLTQNRDKDEPFVDRGSFGKHRLYHPKQPSIPEDGVELTTSALQPFSYGLSNNFAPALRQRHTLAYATSPISDIYLGRRHSTIEQLSQRIRANSLLPGNRLNECVQEAPVGPIPSLMRPDSDAPSAFTKTEFQSEVTSSVPSSQDPAHPLPPPPLPPPNNPPPPTNNNPPTNWCPSHAALTHTASSPTLRQVGQSQTGHHQMLQNHGCPQNLSQPSPLRHSPPYTMSKGVSAHCHGNHHNPEYMSQSEMAYMQVAPPAVYCNSMSSPANSSSGYSSGTTQASHGSLYSNTRLVSDGSDLPPPPPPPTQTTIQSPPPPHAPPPVPPSNNSMDSEKTQ